MHYPRSGVCVEECVCGWKERDVEPEHPLQVASEADTTEVEPDERESGDEAYLSLIHI